MAVAQGGEREGPQVDAGEQVFAEAAFGDGFTQVTVGAGDELEVALYRLIRTHGEEGFFFKGVEQFGLLVEAEFADLVEEKQAFVGLSEEAGPVGLGTGKGSAAMAEEGGGGGVAAEGRAVDFDEVAIESAALVTELVDATGEVAFAGTGGTC